jgi:hypothetical protein
VLEGGVRISETLGTFFVPVTHMAHRYDVAKSPTKAQLQRHNLKIWICYKESSCPLSHALPSSPTGFYWRRVSQLRLFAYELCMRGAPCYPDRQGPLSETLTEPCTVRCLRFRVSKLGPVRVWSVSHAPSNLTFVIFRIYILYFSILLHSFKTDRDRNKQATWRPQRQHKYSNK